MIVKSVNGFIKYYPQETSDLQRFKRIFKIELKPELDYYTFESLLNKPRHSIAGAPYSGSLIAIKTYEGREASDVMKENGFVFSLEADAIVPMLAIPNSVKLIDTANYAVAPSAFLQPGAIYSGTLQRILSYTGWLSLDFARLYVMDRELV